MAERETVLITGASGFIGSAMLRCCPNKSQNVVATSTRKIAADSSRVQSILWTAGKGSIPGTDWSKIVAVVHLAIPRRLFEFPSNASLLYDVIVDGTYQILEKARQSGVERFVLASTGDVLGHWPEGAPEVPGPYEPSSFYGATKASAEQLVLGYREELSVAVARIYHPYGPGGDRYIINRMCDKVLNDETIRIEGENGVIINPVWIDDLAKGLWLALRSREHGIFHFAGPDSMNLRDLILLMGKTMDRAVNIESSDEALVQRNAALCDRASNILGYSPTVSLKAGLRRIYHNLESA